MIKNYDCCLLYSIYVDNNTFLFKNVKFAMELLDTVHFFSIFWGSNSNIFNCEIVDIAALKEVHLAACGLKIIDLISDTLKK